MASGPRFARLRRRRSDRSGQRGVGMASRTMVQSQNAGTATSGLGWTVFAACAAVLIGFFQVMAGLVALFDESYFQVADSRLVVHWSYSVWGTIHLVLGVLLVAAGFGLLVGNTWARK